MPSICPAGLAPADQGLQVDPDLVGKTVRPTPLAWRSVRRSAGSDALPGGHGVVSGIGRVGLLEAERPVGDSPAGAGFFHVVPAAEGELVLETRGRHAGDGQRPGVRPGLDHRIVAGEPVVTFTVSFTVPAAGHELPCRQLETTAGVSTSLPAEMSVASLTYCAIAHISGVEELSGRPKVNPPMPVEPAQTCSEIWYPAL